MIDPLFVFVVPSSPPPEHFLVVRCNISHSCFPRSKKGNITVNACYGRKGCFPSFRWVWLAVVSSLFEDRYSDSQRTAPRLRSGVLDSGAPPSNFLLCTSLRQARYRTYGYCSSVSSMMDDSEPPYRILGGGENPFEFLLNTLEKSTLPVSPTSSTSPSSSAIPQNSGT